MGESGSKQTGLEVEGEKKTCVAERLARNYVKLLYDGLATRESIEHAIEEAAERGVNPDKLRRYLKKYLENTPAGV